VLVKNIALLGFMGCGKTTVGRLLARKLGFLFLDTDSLIEEKSGLSIPRIFELFGESYFRDLETQVLREVASRNRLVLSTGGGLPMRDENWQLLQEKFLTVFLEVPFDTLWKRIALDSGRPLLRRYSRKDLLKELYLKRLSRYREADVIISAGELTPEKIVEAIVNHAQFDC
jgi:shikimate kinase